MYNMYISVIAIKLNSKKCRWGKNEIFLRITFKLEIGDTPIYISFSSYLGLQKGRVNHKSPEPEKSLTWVDLVK